MGYCSLCTHAIRAGEKVARFYLPIAPKRVSRAHAANTRELGASAADEDSVPGLVR
jgi:hypothetical protein